MNSLFFHYLTVSRPIGYVLVFFGMMFEGDIFLLSTSFLTRLGYFDIFDFISAALFGALTGDLFWYWLGWRFGASENRISKYLLKHVKGIKIDFQGHIFKKLLLSKFMYGTHRAVVVFIGISKIKFSRYILAEAPATVIWFIVIGSLGYLFGLALSGMEHYVKYAEMLLFIAVISYIAIFKIVRAKRELS